MLVENAIFGTTAAAKALCKAASPATFGALAVRSGISSRAIAFSSRANAVPSIIASSRALDRKAILSDLCPVKGWQKRSASTNWIRDAYWLNATSPRIIGEEDGKVFAEEVDRLEKAVVASNWGDTMANMLNIPFWEGEYERLHNLARSHPGLLSDPDTARKWVAASRLLDLIFICEDLRDHLNELMEYLDRTNAREKGGFRDTIINLEDHIKSVLEREESLQEKCPAYKKKIDESVGKGIKLMRQRVKFEWKGEHEAFY